jgi:NADH-ubiquinone oxidoreductase chain 2
LLEITTQSLTFTSLIIITGIGLFCLPDFSVIDGFKERHILILSTLLGGILLSSCNDVLTLFLGLELQSYSVYVLAASDKNLEPSEAAGLKYFLLGALSSALIFMGLILIYVDSGITSISYSLYIISHNMDTNNIILYMVGLILVLIGLFWKVAAAPLHAWSIDVYDAVPGRITAILSILPKIGLFSLILQLVLELSKNVYNLSVSTFLIFAIIGFSIFSLLVGGTLGLFSPRIKRLLAYSSILNVGFIIMGCLLGSSIVSFYIIQYIITTMGVWLCLSNFNNEIVLTYQLQGLGNSRILSRVFIGISLSILLLSTAGIPPMIGFFAKYEVIALAIEKGFIFLAIFAVIASLISTVYYLRVFRNI